jgi:hypothetical protein
MSYELFANVRSRLATPLVEYISRDVVSKERADEITEQLSSAVDTLYLVDEMTWPIAHANPHMEKLTTCLKRPCSVVYCMTMVWLVSSARKSAAGQLHSIVCLFRYSKIELRRGKKRKIISGDLYLCYGQLLSSDFGRY